MMRLPPFLFAVIATLGVLHHSHVWAEEKSSALADPLPSWNDGAAKRSILDFAAKVTAEGGSDFVPVELRIATFDNDGTLWTEQPIYVQAFFLLDRIKSLSAQHPEWKEQEPFASVLKGDLKHALAGGHKALEELLMATHAGMTTDEFEKIVTDWLATAEHPRFKRPYTELVYQPMLEVLTFLRTKGFKTYIVSGGGVEFMRPWAEKIYGVPPAHVIGSSIKTKYEVRGGKPVLLRLPELNFIDDHAGKPVGIHSQIGRRPIAAFGNSDGDFEMLEWTTSAPGLRFGMIVHHTDSEREYAYDRKSMVGRLDKGLDEAKPRGWGVIDMKQDWRKIYSFDK
jgi:phosphoserine phosphatase